MVKPKKAKDLKTGDKIKKSGRTLRVRAVQRSQGRTFVDAEGTSGKSRGTRDQFIAENDEDV